MSYCTTAELVSLTGSSLATAVLEEIIAQSDREIGGRLIMQGLSVPASDDTLKSASLNLSKVAVLAHPDSGQTSSSVKLGDITVASADIGVVRADLITQAWQSVGDYIKQNGTDDISKYYIRKVN